MNAFCANPRISVLNSQSLNYCEIRYVISKCKFFVGARTHSVISAYSMCVPAIALGYSIKARGIAKDIGLPDKLVVDFSKDLQKSVLLDSFKYLEENECQVRTILEQNIPPYKKKLEEFDFKGMIENL
jgi:polysaccharide pyruvyl transferase WcaK-like protein